MKHYFKKKTKVLNTKQKKNTKRLLRGNNQLKKISKEIGIFNYKI